MVIEKPIVVVTAVTGKQGRSVAKALLRDGRFHVRGTVRRHSYELTQELEKEGLEVVTMDFARPETMTKAFEGAYGLFMYTTPFECPEEEVQYGVDAARAAFEAGVRHVVFSTLPNLTAASEGRFNVPFFSNKAAIEEEIRKLEFARTTYVELGLFWQNLYEWTPACFEGDALIIAAPISGDAKMPFVDVRDLGAAVLKIFVNARVYNNARVALFAQMASFVEISRAIAEVTNRPCLFQQLSPTEALGKGMLPDLVKAFQVIEQHGYYKDCDIGTFPELSDSLTTRTIGQYIQDSDCLNRWKLLSK